MNETGKVVYGYGKIFLYQLNIFCTLASTFPLPIHIQSSTHTHTYTYALVP